MDINSINPFLCHFFFTGSQTWYIIGPFCLAFYSLVYCEDDFVQDIINIRREEIVEEVSIVVITNTIFVIMILVGFYK